MSGNPQTGNGFTRIANEILEVISKTKLNGTQYRIIIIIWRYTYGFQRKEHKLSLSFLNEATGINKSQIKRELDKLIELNIVTVISEASFNKARIIKFNKRYKEWKTDDSMLNNGQYSKKSTLPELDNGTVPELEYSPVPELEYQERKGFKDNSKENIYIEIFNYWNKHDGVINHKKFTDKQKKIIETALKKNTKEEILESITRLSDAVLDEDFYYNNKWAIDNFLKQSNGISNWLDEGQQWNNYLKVLEDNKQPVKKKYEVDSS